MYELIIIGGGPAGCGASVYAARKRLHTLLITESFGGQSIVSDDIGNWIGEVSISGLDLAKKLEAHVRAQESIEVRVGERASEVKLVSEETGYPVFEVTTNASAYETRAVLVVTGGRRRKLQVPGEDRLNGKGVVYCSTCDAPLFRNKVCAVIGGGNAGLEACVDLFPYASKIYLLSRSESLTGDPKTAEEVTRHPKVEVLYHAITQEILGKVLVSGLKYLDAKTKEVKELAVSGVFVEIGSLPNSESVAGIVKRNEKNEIIVDHQYFTTSQKGVFSAGDVTDEVYKQNNISVGNAVSASLTAYQYILEVRKAGKSVRF
ncbi:MAG: FAD-dependent oxidoreductase [Parcubacteria group bacterium]|nr:FAD-dependent oxidoreductase [Parcubacteria group bacterium]